MNKFERWFLQKILRKQIAQGYCQTENIVELYSMIREATKKEFYEDNDVTISAYLQECFAESNKQLTERK